jgi:hypothetical protein
MALSAMELSIASLLEALQSRLRRAANEDSDAPEEEQLLLKSQASDPADCQQRRAMLLGKYSLLPMLSSSDPCTVCISDMPKILVVDDLLARTECEVRQCALSSPAAAVQQGS